MRHIKLYGIALAAALFIAGCQGTPNEVRENMEKYRENPQIKESGLTYCTVQELQDAKPPRPAQGNMKLPEEIDFSDIEEVGILHLKLAEDFLSDENVEKYSRLFHVDREKMEAGDSDARDTLVYRDEEAGKYMDMWDNGGMAYMAGRSYSGSQNVVEEKYRLGRDSLPEKPLELPGGSVDIASLCRDTEEWLDRNMPIDGISHRISDVFVRRHGDGARTLSMCAEYEYKGMRFDNYTMGLWEETGSLEDRRVTGSFKTELDFEEPGLPSLFSRNQGFTIHSVDPIGQVVSPQSAVEAVEKKMSGFGTFYISDMLPLYILYLPENGPVSGAAVEARPAYAFLTEEKSAEDLDKGIVKPNYYGHFFLVDMVTGEISTDLE